MDFFWRWGLEGRKITWASWDKICKSKGAGGLGMLELSKFNVTLLGKWIWCLG